MSQMMWLQVRRNPPLKTPNAIVFSIPTTSLLRNQDYMFYSSLMLPGMLSRNLHPIESRKSVIFHQSSMVLFRPFKTNHQMQMVTTVFARNILLRWQPSRKRKKSLPTNTYGQLVYSLDSVCFVTKFEKGKRRAVKKNLGHVKPKKLKDASGKLPGYWKMTEYSLKYQELTWSRRK